MFSCKVQLKPEVTELKRRTTSIVGHHDIWVNGQGKVFFSKQKRIDLFFYDVVSDRKRVLLVVRTKKKKPTHR